MIENLNRNQKPRENGITVMIDKGLTVTQIEELLDLSSNYIDYVKLGWGTGFITQNLDAKLSIYSSRNIPVFFGGTLFEYFYLVNKLDDYKKLLDDKKLCTMEISDGSVDIPLEDKVNLIKDFSKGFRVFSEVGSKDEQKVIPPYKWIEFMSAELDAGAEYVITESRESGTGGICRQSGELRYGLIDEVVTKIPPEKIIFEAPNKTLQAWFIKRFGSNVNLANIASDDIISTETLRLGLRGDTLMHFHGK